MRRFLIAVAVVLLPALLLGADDSTWTIDRGHSSVGFSIRHMMISNVRGSFDKFSGGVTGDPKDPTNAVVDVTIESASLNTNNSNRDEHLRSADFFDVTKFPAITYKSKRIEKASDGRLRVIGDLTMHGVTKEVVLDVEGPTPEVQVGNARRIGVTATTRLNRKDYGLNWNRVMEAGGVTVGDEVTINIELELVKREAEAPKS